MHSMQEQGAAGDTMPGGRGCGLSEERAGGRCRASHQGTGWLTTFDKLALRRAASFVYKNTDSKQCSSALNLRPGKSLTHAHTGENKLEDPRLGSRVKVV